MTLMSPSIDRIETAIEKLTNVSIDLKQMIAVHDQRISQQEKTSLTLETKFEKRRELMDGKLKDVYETMRAQDNNVLEEINKLHKELTEQHNVLSNKINQLEKLIWLAIGGGTVITWFLTNLANYLKIWH